VDDVALYDNPAAIAKMRQVLGPEVRIHIISHCLGALSVAMSLFAGTISGVQSVIANGVALTPRVGKAALAMLTLGPFFADYIAGFEYLNPNWSLEPAPPLGKLLAKAVSLLHHECDVPACHMTSFMWGYGQPVLFRHANLNEVTHRRTGDLFGGSGLQYHRHIRKMVKSDCTAVKYAPGDVRYRHLPDNYLQNAAQVTTPMLLVAGQENGVFLDSNVLCHQRLEKITPGRHSLAVIPGYGHADVIMGKEAARDVFPRFLQFLKTNQTRA
jgi:cholesterol oxidase